jgi:hypothetical protein
MKVSVVQVGSLFRSQLIASSVAFFFSAADVDLRHRRKSRKCSKHVHIDITRFTSLLQAGSWLHP